MIVLLDVTEAIERLSRVFPLPERAKADIDAFARTWTDVLRRLTPDQLKLAVDGYLGSEERFFPTPGKLLAIGRGTPGAGLAMDLAGQYAAWEKSGYDDPQGRPTGCPVCGSVPQLVGKRFAVLHDHAAHFRAQVGYVGIRTGPSRNGQMLAPGFDGDTPFLTVQPGAAA